MGIKGMKWNYRTPESKEWHKRNQEIAKIQFEERAKKYEEERRMEEERRQKEAKEGLALLMLLCANGDEEAINKACDIIKAEGLVDGYK